MKLRALSLLAVSILAAQFAAAQIPATDDSYTASSSPTSNYGTQSGVNVIGPGVNGYIRFDLTTLPANLTSSNVSKATLRLNINGVTTSGTFDVYLVTSSWTEGALTYNNAPTRGAKVASAVMITTSKRNFIDVDVTSAVQAWLSSPNPVPNYGIALVPSSGSSISVSFDSKENTSTSHDPELSVAMISSGPQGPTGPAGPAGATGPQGPAGSQGSQGPAGPQGPQGLTGATGPQGIPGVMGLPGPQGPQGNTGPQGPAPAGFTFKGAFDNSAPYVANDVVSFNGSSYVAKTASNPGDPAPDTNPNWSLMAQQGTPGAQGLPGAGGPQGPMGPQGPQGPPGTPPPNVAVTNASNVFTGNQTVNGQLILSGPSSAIQFADGTSQASAASSSSDVPSGFMILSTSPSAPPGYAIAGEVITSGNAWSGTTPMPVATQALGTATVGGKIYAVGGQSSTGVLGTVHVFDPSNQSWSVAAGSMQTARRNFGTAEVSGDMFGTGQPGNIWVIGGRNSLGNEEATVEVYDTVSWHNGPPLPAPVARLAATSVNGIIYAMGGNDPQVNPVSTLLVYDTALGFCFCWTTAAPLPTPRINLAAAALNGKIYAIGGLLGGGLGVTNIVEVYDPSTNAWTTAAPMQSARHGLSVAVANGKIYAMGGNDNSGGGRTAEDYDSSSNTWNTIAPILTPSFAGAATDANGIVYLMGGFVNGPQFLDSVEQYSPTQILYTFVKK